MLKGLKKGCLKFCVLSLLFSLGEMPFVSSADASSLKNSSLQEIIRSFQSYEESIDKIGKELQNFIERTAHAGTYTASGPLQRPSDQEIREYGSQILELRLKGEELLLLPAKMTGMTDQGSRTLELSALKNNLIQSYFASVKQYSWLKALAGHSFGDREWRRSFSLQVSDNLVNELNMDPTLYQALSTDSESFINIEHEPGVSYAYSYRLLPKEGFAQELRLTALRSQSADRDHYKELLRYVVTSVLHDQLMTLHRASFDGAVPIPQLPREIRSRLSGFGSSAQLSLELNAAQSEESFREALLAQGHWLKNPIPEKAKEVIAEEEIKDGETHPKLDELFREEKSLIQDWKIFFGDRGLQFVNETFAEDMYAVIHDKDFTGLSSAAIQEWTLKLEREEYTFFKETFQKILEGTGVTLSSLAQEEAVTLLRHLYDLAKRDAMYRFAADQLTSGIKELEESPEKLFRVQTQMQLLLYFINNRSEKYRETLPSQYFSQWLSRTRREISGSRNDIANLAIQAAIEQSKKITRLKKDEIAHEPVNLEALESALSSEIYKAQPGRHVRNLIREVIQREGYYSARDQYRKILEVFFYDMNLSGAEGHSVDRFLNGENGSIQISRIEERFRSPRFIVPQGVSSKNYQEWRQHDFHSFLHFGRVMRFDMPLMAMEQGLSVTPKNPNLNDLQYSEATRGSGVGNWARNRIWLVEDSIEARYFEAHRGALLNEMPILAEKVDRKTPLYAVLSLHRDGSNRGAQMAWHTALRGATETIQNKLKNLARMENPSEIEEILYSPVLTQTVQGLYPSFLKNHYQAIDEAAAISPLEKMAASTGFVQTGLLGVLLLPLVEKGLHKMKFRVHPVIEVINRVTQPYHRPLSVVFWGLFGLDIAMMGKNYFASSNMAEKSSSLFSTSIERSQGFVSFEDQFFAVEGYRHQRNTLIFTGAVLGGFVGGMYLAPKAYQAVFGKLLPIRREVHMQQAFRTIGAREGNFVWNEAAIRELAQTTRAQVRGGLGRSAPSQSVDKVIRQVTQAEEYLIQQLRASEASWARMSRNLREDFQNLRLERSEWNFEAIVKRRVTLHKAYEADQITKAQFEAFERAFSRILNTIESELKTIVSVGENAGTKLFLTGAESAQMRLLLRNLGHQEIANLRGFAQGYHYGRSNILTQNSVSDIPRLPSGNVQFDPTANRAVHSISHTFTTADNARMTVTIPYRTSFLGGF
jgi:hypothetical protein